MIGSINTNGASASTLRVLQAANDIMQGKAVDPSALDGLTDDQKNRLNDAATVLGTLRHASSSNADRKAAAAAKLAQLKEQLQKLRMLGLSPKALIAMMKELQAAVKSYGSGGGGDIGAAAATPTAPDATSTATGDAAAATPADDGAAADGAAAAAAESDASAPATTADASADPATGTAQTGTPGANSPAPGTTTGETGKKVQAYSTTAATAAAGGNSADADFIRQAKDLAAQLKSLLREALQRQKHEKKASDDQAAEDASKGLDKAISGLDQKVTESIAGLGQSIPASLASSTIATTGVAISVDV